MINLFKKRKLLVTHNGGFHADDVFACAILQIYLDNIDQKYKIVRTRDMEIIKTGDYVFDVGGIYDSSENRFDHHQKGRAGARDNGIYYAACGLVWRKFGEIICKDLEIAEYLDRKIFQALDAPDNGQNLSQNIFPEVFPYSISGIVGVFNNNWTEQKQNEDLKFEKIVSFAKIIIKREITQAKTFFMDKNDIVEVYENSSNKKIIILEKPYSSSDISKTLISYPEPVYFIYPKSGNKGWKLQCVRKNFETFENRKSLPKSWAGLSGEDFIKATNISDAIFCHNGLFLAQTKSKESAVKLAKKAINS